MAKILILDIENGGYQLYSDGRVWSNKRGKFLQPHINMFGYPTVKVNNKNRPLHRLLAENFIPNPLNLETVNHLDKDKENWSLDNLDWCSREDNVKHGLQRTYTLLSPDGLLVTFTGMADFCRDNGLTQANISKVIMGQRPHHKGWRLSIG